LKLYLHQYLSRMWSFLIQLGHITIHGVWHVEAFGDSLLVAQQVVDEFQCLEGSLDAHLDVCLDIIASFAKFWIQHIPRYENFKANMLAQQASGYDIGGHNFHIQE